MSKRIESFVNSDDCGSIRPELAFSRGVQLYVAEKDAPLVEKVMDESITEIPEEEEQED